MTAKLSSAAFLLTLCSFLAMYQPAFGHLPLHPFEALSSVCTEVGQLLFAMVAVVDVRLVVAGTIPFFLFTLAAVLSSLFRTRRLSAELLKHQERPIRQDIGELATQLGIEKITSVVESDYFIAFSYGVVRPRIIVSTALLDYLSAEEMEAVLRHEAWHARHHDPLVATLGLGLRSGLFFVPQIGRTVGRMLTAREIRADDAAISGMGSPYPLASALSKALRRPEVSSDAVVSALSSIDSRIDHILGQPREKNRQRTRGTFVESVGTATIVTLSLCALLAALPYASHLQAAVCPSC